MTYPRAASLADRMADRFCERCGAPAGPQTTLTRSGLTTCRACGIHACMRCWTRSGRSCPACGVSIAASLVLGSLPTEQPRAAGSAGAALPTPASAVATPGHRPARSRLRAPVAAGSVLALTATVFVFVFGAALQPSGGVAGVTGTPGASSPVASGNAVGSGPSAPDRAGTNSPPTGASTTEPPGPQPMTVPRQATPDPPGPRPTPKPTPKPEPSIAPTPAPSRCVATAPNLLGQHRSDAHRQWIAAGFSGAVTALDGQGNYVIGSQDRTPGASYPCDTELTIGP